MSYGGYWGEKEPWQTQGGLSTETILRALNIPTWHLTSSTDIHRRLKDAQTFAHASLHPVAVLLSRELLWEQRACYVQMLCRLFIPSWKTVLTSQSWMQLRPGCVCS